ncbi:MAG: ribonuclease H-like domain-containing protein [Chlorobia bacterium]|nr:ribonuclease H-like domain-containing protein [Fimbriimonadaceae bacterium]
MGRSLGGAAGKDLDCFSQLGWIKPPDATFLDGIQQGFAWLNDLESNGKGWKPSDEKIKITEPGDNDGDWHEAKKKLHETLHPKDENEALLTPATFTVNREEWHHSRGIEFFVDYETMSGLNDDFSLLPKMNGKPMIFMIGCGHEEDGKFEFYVWTAENESPAEEKRVIEGWLDHMEEVRQRLAKDCDRPFIYHWTPHEVRSTNEAADRHGMDVWRDLPWYDLYDKLMKANAAKVRGTTSLSIKPVAKTLYADGKIGTVWGDSPVGDGTAAMCAAWHCYLQAAKKGISTREIALENGTPLIEEVEAYNLVDCKAMWEILRFVRVVH